MVHELLGYVYRSPEYHLLKQNNENNNVKWYYIAAPVVVVVCLLLVFVIFRRKRRLSRRQRRQRQLNTVYVVPVLETNSVPNGKPYSSAPTIPHTPTMPSTPIYKNQENPVYLVPYSALPLNFDFTSPNVEVRGDYVILKDLTLLENYGTSSSAIPIPADLEAYQKQSPYNPNYY